MSVKHIQGLSPFNKKEQHKFTESYVKSVLELQAICLSRKINVKFHMVQSSLVTQGRNLCVQAFLNSHHSHMLFVDSDIEFDPPSIPAMMNHNKDVLLIHWFEQITM